MPLYGSDYFDNDQLRIDFTDLLESPSVHDTLRETITLAGAEDSVEGEELESSVLAAALLVDHLVYATPHPEYAVGLTRLRSEASPDLFSAYASKLGAWVAGISESGALAEQASTLGEGVADAWRQHLQALSRRLDEHYRGTQAGVGEGDG